MVLPPNVQPNRIIHLPLPDTRPCRVDVQPASSLLDLSAPTGPGWSDTSLSQLAGLSPAGPPSVPRAGRPPPVLHHQLPPPNTPPRGGRGGLRAPRGSLPPPPAPSAPRGECAPLSLPAHPAKMRHSAYWAPACAERARTPRDTPGLLTTFTPRLHQKNPPPCPPPARDPSRRRLGSRPIPEGPKISEPEPPPFPPESPWGET